MRRPEEELIEILKKAGVDFTASLPCEKIKILLELIEESFFHAPLTREEEGVGICAGAALSGRKPAMFVQSSGIGNMINAMLSLTAFYELPLAIFVSLRGKYKEKIAAQIPMGKRLTRILSGAAVDHTVINSGDDFRLIEKKIGDVYGRNKMHVFILNPAIWEKSEIKMRDAKYMMQERKYISCMTHPVSPPKLTRYEILDIIAPFIDKKVVVCNLGFPSKELFHIKPQPSNFYMLGSMGLAIPIGLGIALTSGKDVVVIDGDGSILMNPGCLATTAFFAPENLTILAIDNGTYGSTGDQPTPTGSCVDLEIVAQGFGIRNTWKAETKEKLLEAVKNQSNGLRFIHALALPGNKDLPNITLHHLDIKKQVQEFIRG